MTEQYRIAVVESPDDAALTAVGHGLRDFNLQQAGETGYVRLCLFLYGPDQTVAGGLVGSTYWDWMYIDWLWVAQHLRGQGFGHRLLVLAESEARTRGAANAYLDTFSFQAPEFYLRHGYEVFGELEDFPPGHRRFFLRKKL